MKSTTCSGIHAPAAGLASWKNTLDGSNASPCSRACSRFDLSMIEVLTHPGMRSAARIVSGHVVRSSCSRPSVYALRAALLTLYAKLPGGMVMPCLEPVLTTSPFSPLARMRGTKARQPWMGPNVLTPSVARYRDAGARAPPPRPTPALLTSTWHAPASAKTRSASASTAASSATSTTTAVAPDNSAAAARTSASSTSTR
mmetsp:Transcript_4747/g.19355  ORF Transcript_4747/g.19355 Transcript_4747/m.19355 type:complete len:200 (-) Transcript_4747:144-743(-)